VYDDLSKRVVLLSVMGHAVNKQKKKGGELTTSHSHYCNCCLTTLTQNGI